MRLTVAAQIVKGFDFETVVFGLDDDQIIQHESAAAGFVDQLLVLGFVHGGLVGGGQYVNRCALGKLLQQYAGCGGV